jgi:4-amino-4-deoxy-L-arabinose transferase-like glycosyltransferase
LTLGTLLGRLPLLTPRLAHWDAVNYALGLHDFNVASHQPHPPGSPYFIVLGRAALALTSDDNAALIAVSVLASVGAVLAEYWLVKLLWGPRAAAVAAVLLLTQPVFWGYGTMGTPWTLLAFLSLLIAMACLAMVRGNRRLVVPSALLVGVASGFRLDAAVFLAPLWIWSVWKAEPRWTKRALALAVVAVGLLVWFVPVVISSGGPGLWSDRMLAMLPPSDTSLEVKLRQFAANTAISFGTLAFSIGPALGLSLRADRRAVFIWLQASKLKPFWILWIAPAFGFLWLVDSTEPGHNLVYTVALCALGAGLIRAVGHTMRSSLGFAALVVVAQGAVFLFAAPQFDKPLAWTANSMLLNVTEPGLRLHQASLGEALQLIRQQFDPRQSTILTVTGQDPYRFMMYYLPEYLVIRLDPQTRSLLAARAKQQGTWSVKAAQECLLDRGVRYAVWVLAARSEPGVVPSTATHLSRNTDGPFQVWALDLGLATSEYLGFKLSGDCVATMGYVSRHD